MLLHICDGLNVIVVGWMNGTFTVVLYAFLLRTYGYDRVKRAEKNYEKLSEKHKELLPEFLSHLAEIKHCIDHNNEVVKVMIQYTADMFENRKSYVSIVLLNTFSCSQLIDQWWYWSIKFLICDGKMYLGNPEYILMYCLYPKYKIFKYLWFKCYLIQSFLCRKHILRKPPESISKNIMVWICHHSLVHPTWQYLIVRKCYRSVQICVLDEWSTTVNVQHHSFCFVEWYE